LGAAGVPALASERGPPVLKRPNGGENMQTADHWCITAHVQTAEEVVVVQLVVPGEDIFEASQFATTLLSKLRGDTVRAKFVNVMPHHFTEGTEGSR
jgi:hypothetical protein